MNIYDIIANAIDEAKNLDNALIPNNFQQKATDPDAIHYCPHCGKSYYTVQYSMTTCLSWPQIYKDGMLLYSNPNVITTYCHCLNCGQNFSFKE